MSSLFKLLKSYLFPLKPDIAKPVTYSQQSTSLLQDHGETYDPAAMSAKNDEEFYKRREERLYPSPKNKGTV